MRPRTTTLAALEAARSQRPPGYVDAILAAGRYDVDGVHHHIDPAALAAIRSRYGVAAAPSAPSRCVPPPEQPVSASDAVAGQPAALPPLWRQAGNAIKAAARVAVATVAGDAVRAPEAVQQARGVVCRGGDGKPACVDYLASEDRCSRCGCPLRGRLVGKLELATEACPAGKWGVYLPDKKTP